MPSADQAYQNVVRLIEENRLEEAVAALLSFAEQYSPDKVTAVRMRRSEWKALEEEALMMGDTSGIRERRSGLKLQLFRLADAIRKEVQAPSPSDSGAGNSGAGQGAPLYSSVRGEGPVHIFLAYAPDEDDRAGGEELTKSMALLSHLKRIEIFDQQKSPAGNREAALSQALKESEAILLLLSNNFLSDLECLSLQQEAYGLYQQNRAAVIPILYNPCEWKELEIGRLQALPRNGQFITQWANDDEAYAKISREIGELVKNIRARLDYGPAPAPAAIPGSQNESSASLPRDSKKPHRTYNTTELREAFRKGDIKGLIGQLATLVREDGGLYDQVLLLEQRWKEVYEDEKHNTASLESITVRRNKLNQDLLKLLREMER